VKGEPELKVQDIKSVAIAGAGVMGSSIAQIFAKYGYNVTVYDIKDDFLARSKTLIAINQKGWVDEGGITAAESAYILSHISHTVDMKCFKTADLVVEAITENMDIKHKFWAAASGLSKDDALLTTNTSGLSITGIADAVRLPERFCGMHWINPPHIVPLVEVIKGEKTSDHTGRTIYDLSLMIGRKPVLIEKEAKGFLLNRFQFAVLREAMYLVDNGIATKEDIDNVFKYGLGMRYACLGPFEIADLGGLDTFYNIASYLFEDLSDTGKVSPLLAEPFKNGQFGVKSKNGFYDYSDGRDEKVIEKRDRDFLRIAECLFGEDK